MKMKEGDPMCDRMLDLIPLLLYQIDRAGEGRTTFRRFHVVSSVCSPSSCACLHRSSGEEGSEYKASCV